MNPKNDQPNNLLEEDEKKKKKRKEKSGVQQKWNCVVIRNSVPNGSNKRKISMKRLLKKAFSRCVNQG